MSGALFAVLAATASAGVTIQLTTPRTMTFSASGGASAITGYRLANDGFVYTAANAGSVASYTIREQWISDVALVGNYEALVTTSGDALTSGTVGTPVVLSTTRSWELLATPGEAYNTQLTVEIRDTATSTVRATAIINLISQADP